MKASFTGKDEGLRAAVQFVNEKLNGDERFWQTIREKPAFDFATIGSPEVERRIRSIDSTITIRLWKPSILLIWKYWDTVAVTDGRYPRTLLYHKKFLGNDIGSKVNTIVHEFVHNVDVFDDGDPDEQMGHGDEDPTGKENSAPYWIGGLAERFYRESRGSAAVGAEKRAARPYKHKQARVRPMDIID